MSVRFVPHIERPSVTECLWWKYVTRRVSGRK